MPIHKLESVNAFIARDFEPEVPAIGIVRNAPKILQGGAKELARAQTYQCALFELEIAGHSGGISAAGEHRAAAVAEFVNQVLPEVTTGALMVDAGKGIRVGEFAALTSADSRNPLCADPSIAAASVVACADAVRPLRGATIGIESVDVAGAHLVQKLAAKGAVITAVSTSAGSIVQPAGFAPQALVDAIESNDSDAVHALSDEVGPAFKLMGSPCDVLFIGSKIGVLDHSGAPHVKASLVVPYGPIPYTTKGAIMLGRQQVTVLPDLVSTAGSLLAGQSDITDAETLEQVVTQRVAALAKDLVTSEHGAILEACHRAEKFLNTWRAELPFGRPFAP